MTGVDPGQDDFGSASAEILAAQARLRAVRTDSDRGLESSVVAVDDLPETSPRSIRPK
jgi:hypothetical protein